MKKSMRAALITAALTGFVSGSIRGAVAQNTTDNKTHESAKTISKNKKEKHACIGQNSCKGKGGCGKTKGKNQCKGQGGCRTDGRPMKPMS
jgi:hypothetical protein